MIKNLICALLGHHFLVSNTITAHVHEYKCTCCGQEMTDTANGQVKKLTPKFKETNAFVAKVYKRRMQRRAARHSEVTA